MNHYSMFTPETPHFFKIILEETVLNGKLKIPRKFVEKYGNGLPSQALLRVPSGAVWKVELSNYEGRLWLGKGWREFAEYYSLRRGHFLVFKYERRNGHFHVLIFDMSASEIDYPFTKSPERSDSEAEDDASIEIPEGIASSSKKRTEKSPIQSPRPPKMMKATMTRGIEHENVNQHANSSRSKQRFRGGPEHCNGIRRGTMDDGQESQEQSPHILRFKELTAKEKAKALQIANAIKSENPFFLIVVQKCHISDRCLVGTPIRFAKKYLKETCTGEAVLCLNSVGKTWFVRYYHINDGTGRAQVCLREFVSDNRLEAGDVCVFELLKATDIVSFKVAIHRDVKYANFNQSQNVIADNKSRPRVDCKIRLVNMESGVSYDKACMASQRRERTNRNVVGRDDDNGEAEKFSNQKSATPKGHMDGLKRAKGAAAAGDEVSHDASTTFTSKYPFFKRVINLSHENSGRVDIPPSFIEKYFEADVEEITLQVADRLWPVKLKKYVYLSSRTHKLGRGWARFATENSIRVGDVCVFELIDLTKAVLEVSVFRDGRQMVTCF